MTTSQVGDLRAADSEVARQPRSQARRSAPIKTDRRGSDTKVRLRCPTRREAAEEEAGHESGLRHQPRDPASITTRTPANPPRVPLADDLPPRRPSGCPGWTSGSGESQLLCLPSQYAARLFDAQTAGASEQQLQNIAAEGLQEQYFKDRGRRADGLVVEFTDIDYVELDYS
ncbi:XRE family transcriptional regulator [Streptomyces sp. NBC_01589]|uniref:XRE family transcriptional regulator n=1 Tax=Streptomyces sp. NBC_01589 TaxID=2975886 RepID=UPI00386C4DB8